MRFERTPISGAWIIDIEPSADERGFFARTVCVDEFRDHGLTSQWPQQSISWNPREGTLRGLHYQASPHEEEKLVRVTRGAIYDVIIDLREQSDTFGRWFGLVLNAEDRRQLYIPKGVAHGFQTLAPDTEILYEISVRYVPEAARGVRWDDPKLGIDWPPCENRLICQKDRAFPLFGEAAIRSKSSL